MVITLFLTITPPENLKGKRLLQNMVTTAIIAPSWITMLYKFQKSPLTLSKLNSRNSSNIIKWPVLETGSHSVIPSTMPKNIDFKISKNPSNKFNSPLCYVFPQGFCGFMVGFALLLSCRKERKARRTSCQVGQQAPFQRRRFRQAPSLRRL